MNKGFIAQTAKDYDMEFWEVEDIYRRNSHQNDKHVQELNHVDFYQELERKIIERANL